MTENKNIRGICPFCGKNANYESRPIIQENTNPTSPWFICEFFDCAECGKFNMCIDRTFESTKNRLQKIKTEAKSENKNANARNQQIFWLDQPLNDAVLSLISVAIANGNLKVKYIQEIE